MGAESGMEDAPLALRELEEELRANPTAFGFFQAVRLLEQLRPDREPVGHFVDPSTEVARFSVHRSMAFPPSEIQSLRWSEDGPAELKVNFLGLTGPQGVLPHHYTQLTLERGRARESPLGDFLDLFHHRILSLFYRAWKKYRVTEAVGEEDDPLREHVLDLVGMGIPGMRRELPFEENALVFYAGLLSAPQRSAAALEQLLEDYFEVPVEVRQFEGAWYSLGPDDLCALGEEESGLSSLLGRGAVVGDEIWDPQSRIRIRLGPLSLHDYRRFLPDGDAHGRMRELTRFFGNDEYEFELQLVLAADEVPGMVLGADEASPQPLGWSSWIRSTESSRDADDTILML